MISAIYLTLTVLLQTITFFDIMGDGVTFRILHQNIANALSKKDLLELTLSDLRDSNRAPDIMSYRNISQGWS